MKFRGHTLNERRNTNVFWGKVWGYLFIQKPTKMAHTVKIGTEAVQVSVILKS